LPVLLQLAPQDLQATPENSTDLHPAKDPTVKHQAIPDLLPDKPVTDKHLATPDLLAERALSVPQLEGQPASSPEWPTHLPIHQQ
ncbi:hypothetical protein, partial [Bacillus safensis]|uniref:hypothetical protein n=1 Tax=Bacillus safensis TaxID=561879 RepID=UPI0022B7BBA5